MAENPKEMFIDVILATIQSGVICIDASDIITTCNTSAALMLRLNPSAILGKRYQDAFQSLPQVIERSLTEILLEAQTMYSTVTQNITFTTPESSEVHLSFYVTSVRDSQGAYLGMIIAIENRTGIARMEAEIKRTRK